MGIADGPARAGAQLAIDLVVDNELTFTTTTNVYSPLTGVNVPTAVNADVKAVSASWTKEELRDEPTRASMLKLLIAQADLDAKGVDLQPTTEVAQTVVYKGAVYKFYPVRIVPSGDEIALVIIGIRK